MLNNKLILRACLLIICLIGFGSVVSAQTETKTPVAKGSVSGETYRYKFSDADFSETPSWKSEDGEPPISITRAASIAKSNLPRFVTGAESFEIRRILLNAFGNDKWFYNISFSCREVTCRTLPTRQFSMIVKMDGTILEPKKIVETN